MSDRREPDEHTIALQQSLALVEQDIKDLTPLPAAISKLNTSIEVLNNTLKILGLVFTVVFPILCAWNYYLGRGVTSLETAMGKHEMQIRTLENDSVRMHVSIEKMQDNQRSK